jgi:hypothetical protein
MKTYGGVEVQILVFFTSTLLAGEQSASCSGRFHVGEISPITHCTEIISSP